MTALLAGGHLLGIWHYRSCERLRRRSLEARDQTLRTYADRLRDTAALSSALAHELNNPLASVTGLAALMECDVARAPERLRLLRREVARMGTVISEYLDFARPLAPLALATVDLRELVTSVFDLVRGPASRKRLRLETPDCDALPIRCDPGKVREILLYLIQNAIEASPVGGTIAVLLGRDSRRVRIEVLDNGPGVPRDLLDVIMKPGMSTKENASGLGLTIACSFAAQHDGAIALSNREQGGLSAVVELPRTCPATDPAKVLV